MMKKRMLVVDDSEFEREIIKRMFKGHSSFEIVEAIDGKNALEILANDCKFNLILLDINMPEIKGDTVLKVIRENPELKQIPVIIFSSFDSDETISEYLKLGANDYITKPIRLLVAKSRIENQIKIEELHHLQNQHDALQAIKALVVTYNHEVNNPLTIALMNLELYRSKGNEEALNKIETALIRIKELIKNLQTICDSGSINYDTYSQNVKIIKVKNE